MIIFGAGKIPDIGSGVGKAIHNFKKATTEVEDKEPNEIIKSNNDTIGL